MVFLFGVYFVFDFGDLYFVDFFVFCWIVINWGMGVEWFFIVGSGFELKLGLF